MSIRQNIGIILLLVVAIAVYAAPAPCYLFCGAGDNLYNTAVEPVDSPATIDALLDYTASTYGIKRLYWRAIGDWADDMKVGRVLSPSSWAWSQWLAYLHRQFGPDRTAARLAHSYGMEAFCYAGLFEFGLAPDESAGYRFEFNLRRNHPEWVVTDRWGERPEAGPLSYANADARAALVKYFTELVMRDGFDGINFYTYVENFAIHYENEFGFDQKIVERFSAKYPEVDLRNDILTSEQAEYWYECRGHFVTLFLRELSASLHANGKKLSMILAAEEPDYVQPWWGMPIRGNGKIRLEYEKWIKEGIVDEIWVQLADVTEQRRTLDKLLPLVDGTPVKLTVRAVNPFDAGWDKYREAGVSPIAVITWARNGIEAYTLQAVSAKTLDSADWKVRAQTLRAIAKGGFTVPLDKLLAMVNDPHVLVRRALYGALAVAGADAVPAIEAGFGDRESSVRIAAALALQKVNRPQSAAALLAAVGEHPEEFQLKITAVDTLKAIGVGGYDTMVEGLANSSPIVREVAGCGLRKLAIHNLVDMDVADGICDRLQKIMVDDKEDTFLRLTFIEQSIGMRANISNAQQDKLIDDVTALVENGNWEVQLKAAGYGGNLSSLMDDSQRQRMKSALCALFKEYGDGCHREDAAYGWRDVGNALIMLGGQAALEEMMNQRNDAFTAYNAYRVIYDRQGVNPQSLKNKGFNLIDEAEAVENHRKYAPPYPGRRSW